MIGCRARGLHPSQQRGGLAIADQIYSSGFKLGVMGEDDSSQLSRPGFGLRLAEPRVDPSPRFARFDYDRSVQHHPQPLFCVQAAVDHPFTANGKGQIGAFRDT